MTYLWGKCYYKGSNSILEKNVISEILFILKEIIQTYRMHTLYHPSQTDFQAIYTRKILDSLQRRKLNIAVVVNKSNAE